MEVLCCWLVVLPRKREWVVEAARACWLLNLAVWGHEERSVGGAGLIAAIRCGWLSLSSCWVIVCFGVQAVAMEGSLRAGRPLVRCRNHATRGASTGYPE